MIICVERNEFYILGLMIDRFLFVHDKESKVTECLGMTIG